MVFFLFLVKINVSVKILSGVKDDLTPGKALLNLNLYVGIHFSIHGFLEEHTKSLLVNAHGVTPW